MKNRILAALSAAVIGLTLAACGDTSKVDSLIDASSMDAKDQYLDELAKAAEEQAKQGATETVTTNSYALPSEQLEGIDVSNGEYDVDLTLLDANITYAQVYDMMLNPDKYKGQHVRANGTFAYTYDNDKDYFAIMIADAMACCAQGMEFRLANESELKYPDDYPEVGDEVIITGDFNSYKEGSYTYIELQNATLEMA